MNPRIACFSLALLSLTACGQTGPLVLPEKNVPPPKAAEVKPEVVAPIPDATQDTAAPAPTEDKPEASKKVQP